MNSSDKSVREVIDLLNKFFNKYNEYYEEIKKHCDDDIELEKIKAKYRGYTSIYDFPYSFRIDFDEIDGLYDYERKYLGLPDYFDELRGDIGKETKYGRITGLVWFIDDICYIIESNDDGIKYWPVNMKINKE